MGLIMKKAEVLQVRMSARQKKELERQAEKKEMSISEYVRMLIDLATNEWKRGI